MSFWSSIFGTNSGSTSETTLKQTQHATGQQTTNATQTQNTQASTLDPQTVALLRSVVNGLSGNIGQSADADAIRSFSQQLAGNSDQNAVEGRVSAAEGEARRQYNLGEGANIGQVVQQIGSRGNSFASLLSQNGNIDLATAVANAGANIRAQGAQQHSQDLSSAISGMGAATSVQSAPLQQFLAAITALTGTQTTSSSTATLAQTLQTLQDALTNQETHGKTSSTSYEPLMNML